MFGRGEQLVNLNIILRICMHIPKVAGDALEKAKRATPLIKESIARIGIVRVEINKDASVQLTATLPAPPSRVPWLWFDLARRTRRDSRRV